jgi:serine/threonine-protein kinase
MKRAQTLDPLSPIISAAVGRVYYWARRYDLAIDECQKTFGLYPNYPIGLNVLGDCYLEKSMYKEAISTYEKSISDYGDLEVLISGLGRAYAFAGQKEEACRILAELDSQAKQRYISSYSQAQIYLGLGDKDKALIWLEKAYKERYGWLPFLGVYPYWDSLRDEPRFQELLKKMRLER